MFLQIWDAPFEIASLWQFLELQGQTASLDLEEYSVKNLPKLLGILISFVGSISVLNKAKKLSLLGNRQQALLLQEKRGFLLVVKKYFYKYGMLPFC